MLLESPHLGWTEEESSMINWLACEFFYYLILNLSCLIQSSHHHFICLAEIQRYAHSLAHVTLCEPVTNIGNDLKIGVPIQVVVVAGVLTVQVIVDTGDISCRVWSRPRLRTLPGAAEESQWYRGGERWLLILILMQFNAFNISIPISKYLYLVVSHLNNII